jgi:predicted nuclease of predicted toxin-antitoxin system
MRFLVDASLPRSVGLLIRSHGHEAVDARDIGMRRAPDSEVAAYALNAGAALISGDFDFGDIRIHPPQHYSGLVIVDRPEDATVPEVLDIVRSLLIRPDIVNNLPGHLVIVDAKRIRLRPPLPPET